MDDHFLKASLSGGSVHHFLIDGASTNHPIDHYGFHLTDAMGTILGLQIALGVLYKR